MTDTKYIPIPTIGEMLKEEFMIPLGLSAYRLSKEIDVPSSRILDIIHGKRSLTVDTALRLSHYFGMSDRFFLNLQTSLDVERQKMAMKDILSKLPKYAGKDGSTVGSIKFA